MVEGPKVQIKCSKLQCLVGQRLIRAEYNKTCLLDGRGLASIAVSSVVSVGKELFIVLSNDSSFRLHFGMSGTQRVSSTNDNGSSSGTTTTTIPSRLKLTISLVCEKHAVVFYGTTLMVKYGLYLETALSRRPRDIMTTDLDINQVVYVLRTDSRPIHEAIMDQTILPGVGNIIKCEGLYNARIHPDAKANEIERPRLRKLIEALQRFAFDWYKCTLQNKEVKKSVYGKVKCSCESQVTLVRSGTEERITYYCNACQKLEHSYAASDSFRKSGALLGWLSGADEKENSSRWSCTLCTFLNPMSTAICGACATKLVPSKESISVPSEVESQPVNVIDDKSTVLLFKDAPQCRCKAAASLQRVRKDGPTHNRLFYHCGSHSKLRCEHFAWADQDFPRCHHDKVAILRRVLKPGDNNGRYFFCCSLEKQQSCNYFEFVSHHAGASSSDAIEAKKRKSSVVDDGVSKARKTQFVLPLNSSFKLPL